MRALARLVSRRIVVLRLPLVLILVVGASGMLLLSRLVRRMVLRRRRVMTLMRLCRVRLGRVALRVVVVSRRLCRVLALVVALLLMVGLLKAYMA